jgi:hypothetical protein
MLPDDYSEPLKLESNKIHPNSIANLRPATAGEVRNPLGRPVGSRHRSTIAKEWLQAVGKSEDGLQLPYEDLITLAAIKKAMTGDVAAYNALNDNAYGKLTDKKEHIITQKAEQLSDDELANIAATGSDRINETAETP